MSTERFDQELALLLETAEPVPELRPGWEQRAMGAMAAAAAVPQRRMPRLATVIVVVLLLLLLAAGVFAAVRYFFVEGTLHIDTWQDFWPGGASGPSSQWLSGELEWSTEVASAGDVDLSPATGELAYVVHDEWPCTYMAILKANPDGSEPVNLTELAGLGGVNCYQKWSPDGSMISFQHSDPTDGVLPCDAGFHVWVMNADGSDAHPVLPEGSPRTWRAQWLPDGSRLVCCLDVEDPATFGADFVGTVTTDLLGTDVRALPNVGDDPAWSPDGTMIASIIREDGEMDGQPGHWIQLLLTNAEGSDPEVLVQQFISEADMDSCSPSEWQIELAPGFDWKGDLLVWAGPLRPEWSPNSDKIAFLAAMPWDPDGPYHKLQTEVWVYDLTADELIQVTDDDVAQTSVSWK
jgi:Tol biopolymer transport system component